MRSLLGRERPTVRQQASRPPVAGKARALLLLRGDAHGRGMAGELHSLTGVGHLVTLDLENRQIAVDEVADVHVLPVGTKHDPFGQAAYFDLADLGYLLAVDLK